MPDTPLHAVREPHLRLVAIYRAGRLLASVTLPWRGPHDPTPFGAAADTAMAAHGWSEYGPTEILADTNNSSLHVTRRPVRRTTAPSGR